MAKPAIMNNFGYHFTDLIYIVRVYLSGLFIAELYLSIVMNGVVCSLSKKSNNQNNERMQYRFTINLKKFIIISFIDQQ